jgi:hypothetical protein
MWGGLSLMLATLILTGCATEDHLKPPRQPECFLRPPDEKRFEKPPMYPKEFLMQDANKGFDLTAQDPVLNKSGNMGMGMHGGGGFGGY